MSVLLNVNDVTLHTGLGISSDYNQISIDGSFIEYIDFLYKVLGIDINYEKFKYLSPEDKISLLRDSKINRILE